MRTSVKMLPISFLGQILVPGRYERRVSETSSSEFELHILF